MESKKLPAKLSVSRFQSNTRDNGVHIRVIDAKSHTCVLELEISVEEFGHAVLGLSERECEATWKIENLGLVYEHKTEFVPIKKNVSKEKALAKFEVDGWKGRIDDYGNYHKHAKRNGVEGFDVVFTRYVEE
jgi:hypothetical protein